MACNVGGAKQIWKVKYLYLTYYYHISVFLGSESGEISSSNYVSNSSEINTDRLNLAADTCTV